MTKSDWQSLREKLNHDILCNQVRIEIQMLRQNPSHEPVRLEWFCKRHADTFRGLLEDAPDALSTKKLVGLPCFNCWPQEYKSYFANLFHSIFLLETDLNNKMNNLNQLLENALKNSWVFLETKPAERTEAMVINLQEILDKLSLAISKLPKPYIGVN